MHISDWAPLGGGAIFVLSHLDRFTKGAKRIMSLIQEIAAALKPLEGALEVAVVIAKEAPEIVLIAEDVAGDHPDEAKAHVKDAINAIPDDKLSPERKSQLENDFALTVAIRASIFLTKMARAYLARQSAKVEEKPAEVPAPPPADTPATEHATQEAPASPEAP